MTGRDAPDEAAWLVTVTCPGRDAELLADSLWAAGARAIEERPAPHDSDQVTLIAGFATDHQAEQGAQRLVAAGRRAQVDPAPPPELWRDVWLDHLEPMPVGSFIVRPPWCAGLDGDARSLIIDPGQAFGSGQHPSTVLAVEALQTTVTSGDHVLDVGTGTGILAIAAAKLGASRAVGIDIDPAARTQAQTNARANGTGTTVDITDHALSAVDATFDLVVANITCHSLLPLIADLLRRAERDLVVSGLLVDQSDLIVDAVGIAPRVRRERDEWCALAFDLT